MNNLDALSCLIDWVPADLVLLPRYPAVKGGKAWPSLAMFEALLLAAWYYCRPTVLDNLGDLRHCGRCVTRRNFLVLAIHPEAGARSAEKACVKNSASGIDQVARSYRELFAGYAADPREYLKRTFEEVGGYDELVTPNGRSTAYF